MPLNTRNVPVPRASDGVVIDRLGKRAGRLPLAAGIWIPFIVPTLSLTAFELANRVPVKYSLRIPDQDAVDRPRLGIAEHVMVAAEVFDRCSSSARSPAVSAVVFVVSRRRSDVNEPMFIGDGIVVDLQVVVSPPVAPPRSCD